MELKNKQYQAFAVCAALALVTLGIYWQVHRFEFISCDDPGYVANNDHLKAGLSWSGFIWAFTTGTMSNWHPVTWLSYMLDSQIFGLNAGWYHIVNVILHIANTLLLFVFLRQTTKSLWPSAFVAALFALHPLHVESVVWISERKDVLSTFLGMLTLLAYVRYVRSRGLLWYVSSLVLFALSLMAKPMLVTLPLVLLLLDYWPLERLEPGSKPSVRKSLYPFIIEKIPFFVLAAASSVVTFLVQKAGGAIPPAELYPLRIRVNNAIISYVEYIGKIFWPAKLAVFYPHPGDAIPVLQIALSVLLLVVMTATVLYVAQKHKYLPVGWLWYLITLVPVIGIIQAGGQGLADRYTYVPFIGLFIAITWAARDIAARLSCRKIITVLLASSILAFLGAVTYLQLRIWHDSISLFEHAIAVTRDNAAAEVNLADALLRKGRLDEALPHFEERLRLSPDGETHNNIAFVLNRQGRYEDAIRHCRQAIDGGYNGTDVHFNLAIALHHRGLLNEAVSEYEKVLQSGSRDAVVHDGLGGALTQLGRFDEAIVQFREAMKVNPDYVPARKNLEMAITLRNNNSSAGQFPGP